MQHVECYHVFVIATGKYLLRILSVTVGYMLYSLDFIQILWGILVAHVGWTKVKFEIWSVVLKVIIVRQL